MAIASNLLTIRKQFKSPKLLHAKRIAATDERRKAQYQQALSHIGIAAILILATIVILSLNVEYIRVPVTYIVWALSLSVLYLAYWMRK
ncbi:hypothetical protein RyT2_03660 [Pseudolactococcus yaeyamensis]